MEMDRSFNKGKNVITEYPWLNAGYFDCAINSGGLTSGSVPVCVVMCASVPLCVVMCASVCVTQL